MSIRDGNLEVALTRAGHLDVAVPAARISGIRRASAEGEDLPRISLAACLGVAAPGARPATSYLQIRDEDLAFELGVDGQVKIRRVELSSLHRLPGLVSELGPRVGISGLVDLDDELVFYIDLDAMTRWVVRDDEG